MSEEKPPENRIAGEHDKKAILESALARGRTQVRLDARRPGVRVPDHLAQDPQLALNLSWRFPAEMVINDRGVAATLRFGGVPFRCHLPWSAVWGIHAPSAESLQVFAGEVPPELGGPPRPDDEADPPPIEPMKPRLSVLRAPPSLDAAAPVAAVPAAVPPAAALSLAPASDLPAEERPAAPRAPWLKLVK